MVLSVGTPCSLLSLGLRNFNSLIQNPLKRLTLFFPTELDCHAAIGEVFSAS